MTLALVLVLLGAGCASDTAITVVKEGDYELTCRQLKSEVATLARMLEESDGNASVSVALISGLDGKEFRSKKNQKTVAERLSHISNLFMSNCKG